MELENAEEVHAEARGEAAKDSPKSDHFLPISIIVAAAVIGGSILFATLFKASPSGPGLPGSGTGTAAGNGQPAADAMKLGPRDAAAGNAGAPVTIIEYGDYQCPFCTRFFVQTQLLIMQNYVAAGRAKLVFRDFPFLGPESQAAAEAAQCANDQGKLWAYHDALYAAKFGDEQKGGGENDGFYNRALFLKLARQTGLDAAAFTACIDGNKNASFVAQEKTAASAAGVDSTPTFFVNGASIVGAEPYAAFQAAIDAALKG